MSSAAVQSHLTPAETEFSELIDLFRLPSINCELSTREIYAKVKLSADALRQ